MSVHDKSESSEQELNSPKTDSMLMVEVVNNDGDGEELPRTESIFNPPLLNRIRQSL